MAPKSGWTEGGTVVALQLNTERAQLKATPKDEMKTRSLLTLGGLTMIASLGLGCGGKVEWSAQPESGSGGALGSPAFVPPSQGSGGAVVGTRPTKSQPSKAPSSPPASLGEAGAPSSAKAGAPNIGEAAAPNIGEAGAPSSGQGGTTAPGGAPSTSGGEAGAVGFAPAPKCAGFTFFPSTPLLTGAFSGSVAIPSVIYAYTAPGLVPASFEVITSNAVFTGIHIQAEPGLATDSTSGWLGVGLPLAGCVDATAYRGVEFTITGDLGNCAVTFGLVTSADNSESYGGSCQGSDCYGPSSPPLSVGTSVIWFSDMAGGSPESRVNPATLNDLQWQLTAPFDDSAPPCVADFTVSDVSFVR
jgi:hypothetical protein